QELKENLVAHSPNFQNTSEPFDASTNIVNAPREPNVVKQDNGSFVDKIIFRTPDSPDQFHCFHCKTVLRAGEPVNDVLAQNVEMVLAKDFVISESPITLDSTPTYVDESPNVFNPPPQPSVYPCEFCGNDAYYGHYCTSQAPLIYPEPCYNQDFNFLQYFQDVPQQYTCCDDCGVTHEPYQCQPMNEVYDYGQNSCYDSTSIGFDQSQPQQYTINHPIFNAHKSCLNSRIQLNSTLANIQDQMTSITSLCELACQFVQKKLEEKQLEEEQAAKAQYWKPPVCCDDDDDEESSKSLKENIISKLPPCLAVKPKEPVDSLIMRDEHLNTILAMESDEFIKSCVENLVLNPSESEGKNGCDVPAGFTTFSNARFDADYDSDSSDDQSLPDEDEEIRLTKKLLYDNSSPRPPEEFDLTFTPDDPMPPSIKDDEDSKGDILFLERLLHD
nr:hypothetical protein [Tanacetum cinerariifolium]